MDIHTKLKRLNDECGMMSVTSYALELPLAKEIISMPNDAIPAILSILKQGNGWMLHISLLEAMLPDVNPYSPKTLGKNFVGYDVKKAISAWVNWGIYKGIIH